MPDSIVITSRVCYTHHAFEEDEDGALRCLNCGGARCELLRPLTVSVMRSSWVTACQAVR